MYVQVLRALSEVFELCSKLLSLVVKSDSSNFSSSDVALLDRISKVSDLIVSSKYVWMHAVCSHWKMNQFVSIL